MKRIMTFLMILMISIHSELKSSTTNDKNMENGEIKSKTAVFAEAVSGVQRLFSAS